ncbi:uncharacterized protein LOC131026149 [Salvia miltiorrhiza]|uniref:uncharacterized protein LOC131026149 n=1 Tax=Salvia miltiorrhiza TaxID=226208 RepID=UPI0025AB6F22|nr:uncharacterized protein LOC131026149 [Salvia miltiorrhiza]
MRLYRLSANRNALISESGRWENGEWQWELRWRRELFERERVGANELLSAISLVSLKAEMDDGWQWKADKNSIFSAKSAYSIISEVKKEAVAENESKESLAKVWRAPAPHKARTTAWRILRNRLPTCDNLLRRNIPLQVADRGCNACFHQQESINHLLLHCPKTRKLWDEVYKWLGICFVQPLDVVSHFRLFTEWSRRKESRKFLRALWCCINWVLWRCRNLSRFEDKVWEINDVVLEIKAKMWSWGRVFGMSDVGSRFMDWISRDSCPLLL